MTQKNKAALLGAILAATVAEDEKKSFLKFENTYDGLPELTYSGGNHSSIRKTQLTNKQKKRRAASKQAKRSRKRNRKAN